MPLGNSSYLRFLTGNRNALWATCFGICTTPIPNPIGTERRASADSGAHGKISGHFIRQPKCYLTKHLYLKPSHPTSGLSGKLRPSTLAQKSLAKCSPATRSVKPALTEPGWNSIRTGAASRARDVAVTTDKGKNVSIHTDPKYPFQTVHAPGAIWKERGLSPWGNKGIKHTKEILKCLSEFTEPDCHKALPGTPGWVPNKPGKPNGRQSSKTNRLRMVTSWGFNCPPGLVGN
ncbi:LOW QUALITY PROTEIN: hypothetical protein QTO34_008523 [Cnephaeus nilssonii]|uniref:Uncharacterized protein n=1 Tax=Cnephaeus nilssonii TaxID=3371016 RepID=A0AA40IAF7_CNENI|nr:LOW QUALITY PROTEIN: hypothetical protein QTO34_008523 [Eptesicus nilssonii]